MTPHDLFSEEDAYGSIGFVMICRLLKIKQTADISQYILLDKFYFIRFGATLNQHRSRQWQAYGDEHTCIKKDPAQQDIYIVTDTWAQCFKKKVPIA